MHRALLLTALCLGSLACGDDSGPSGTGGSGSGSSGATSTTSSSTGSASSSSSSSSSSSDSTGTPTTGVGGDGGGGGETTGVGGGGGDTGVGGAGDPVCPSEQLCEVIVDNPDKQCTSGFDAPLSPDLVAGARCVLEALRDRTHATVRVGYSAGGGYCSQIDTISIGAEVLYVHFVEYEDKSGSDTASGWEPLPAAAYQDCLDLPDDELHTCFGTYTLFAGPAEGCPTGCECFADG